MSEAEEQQAAEEPAQEGEGLTQEAKDDVRSLIAKYDKSGNGKLEYDEFLGFMKEGLGVGDSASPNFLKQMRFIFDGMDTDGSHNLDQNEIITCLGKLKDKDFKYITRMIFRGADVDKSRKVSIDELKQACESIGGKTFSEDEFKQKCEVEFGKKKKELEYWEFYKLISGETLSKDSPDYDPYEGKLPEKSKCCILI
ncbi:Lipopolysaccharide kinase (Kdo/WaaP) [Tritrichomonas musculus]|uniref:Lipopolysaccharide kinase (Kdo/WaaP) n=1 Tax=Tritrichomonas musculus TaxID=1915356 RepID=A0ABR2L4R2_9EUKA